MTGRRYGYSRRYKYKTRDAGREAARRHIEEGRRLSVALGGTDKDVKEFLFSLDQQTLTPILDEYENRYGRSARDYAEQTIPRWRNGSRKMSGLVAGRLFSLLPRHMPLRKKYELVKSLWENKCPSSRKCFYVGPDADHQDVCGEVKQHLSKVVQEYKIPESITKRFQWLAQDDVELQQELCNYFLQLNREVVSEAADHRVPSLLNQMRVSSDLHQQIRQTIKVGNHQLELVFHPKVSGISTERPLERATVSASTENSWGCLIVLAIIIFILALLANAG